MSQPNRRSRKTKLVPRSTEGGEPEIKEIKMEDQQIKIMNTRSTPQHRGSQPQARPQPASKTSESLQFKVDIEVEEWIDDELFIEENFAKMQSDKLSEALDKEIKEEVDWTNDEYGKFWAEAASDSETEEKPLNEYEKLIKNQIDPSLLAGPSKTAEPEPKKPKLDEKNHKTKKKKGDPKQATPKQIPKPNLKVKQYVRPAKRLKNNEPTGSETCTTVHVSDVNLQPKLRINIVFDDPKKPTNPEDQTKKIPVLHKVTAPSPLLKSHTPSHVTVNPEKLKFDTPQTKVPVNNLGKPISNKPQLNVNPQKPKSIIKVNNPEKGRPMYIVPAKTETLMNKVGQTKAIKAKKSLENIEGPSPSSSGMTTDMKSILKRPIYFIEVNKTEEKVNKAQLRHMAYKSISKKDALDEDELHHIVVSEDAILSAANALSQVDDKVIKILNIELRNRIGCTRFENIEMSREDALVDYAYRQWFVYHSKSKMVPLLYKCYICNDGWWHLEPFRAHIKKHSYVSVVLEKHNFECNIIAHNKPFTRPFKYRIFPIDQDCWRCGKGYAYHMGLEKTAYKCTACDSSLSTCLNLKEHMGVCLGIWKQQMELQGTKDIRAFKCKICPQIFFTEEQLHKHQFMFHVPRSDYPMVVNARQCSFCNRNYVLYIFHFCRSKLQKHVCPWCHKHYPSAIAMTMHLQNTKTNVKCQFCDEVVDRECSMMDHLLKHTDKFMLVYKCLMCPTNILLEDYAMVQRHVAYIHKSKLNGCLLSWAKMIIPRSLYKDNKCKIVCNKKPTKSKIFNEENKGEDEITKETSNDSNKEDSVADDLKPDVKVADDSKQDVKVADDSNKEESVAEDLKPDVKVADDLKQDVKDDSKQDESNSSATGPEESEVPEEIDVKPTIKIENVMDEYYEEDTPNMDTEIDIKPIIPASFIKVEVEDMEATEVNVTEVMDFEEVAVKQEKPDDCEAETSKNSSENKQFTVQIQNFLEKLDAKDYEVLCQNDINDKLTCVACDFVGTHKQYKRHMKECKSAEIDENFLERECTKCVKVFRSMKEYVKHLRVHGFIICHCKECDMEFSNLSTWSKHIIMHINQTFARVKLLSNNTKVFMCKVCKDIVNQPMFFKHWEVHIHQESSQEIHYDSDGSISRKLLGVIIDIFKATAKKKVPNDCVVCGRYFMRFNEKKRHLAEHLLEAASDARCSTGVLQCQICKAGFNKPDQFRRHMRDHAGLPVYHCDLCYKTFSDSSNFVKHKKCHNLDSYVCDMCNKKFVTKSSLVAHIATHCPEPMRCIRCPDKLFYCESMYRRHVRTSHDKVNHFSCIMCRERFSSVKEKWDHQWAVHRMRNQIADCPDCDAKFRKVSDLKRHLVHVHRMDRSVENRT